MLHDRSCPCCGGASFGATGGTMGGAIGRRRFLGAAAAVGAATLLAPRFAIAAEGHYEAMVLSCIDPRLQEPVRKYADGRGLTGKYSHFVIAGAAIGVVAEPFKDWHKAFWDNLGASIQLHHIKRVIAIDHRDCGGAKIAYGADRVSTRERETETHREALGLFRRQVGDRHPALGVDTGLMAIDGSIEMFT